MNEDDSNDDNTANDIRLGHLYGHGWTDFWFFKRIVVENIPGGEMSKITLFDNLQDMSWLLDWCTYRTILLEYSIDSI